MMKRLVLIFALLWAVAASALPLRGGGSTATGSNALQTLIAAQPHNTWVRLTTASPCSDFAPQTLAYWDAGYVSTTGTWASSATTISVTSASGIQVGDAVQGVGIPVPDWVTNISGTTITLFTATTGSGTGAAASFSSTWFSDATVSATGCTGVWAFSHAAIKTSPPAVSIQGGGDTDSGDHTLYRFDPVACAASINAGNTTNCHWQIKVKGARYQQVYFNGAFGGPTWSCQLPSNGSVSKVQDTFVTTGTIVNGNTSVTVASTASLVVGADVWDANALIKPGTTVAAGTSGTTLVLSQAPTGSSSGAVPIWSNSATSSDQIWVRAATLTAGSTTGTLNSTTGMTSGANNFVSGPGVGAGTRITSFSGTTITLSQPAILNETGTPLYIADEYLGTTNADGVQVPAGAHAYFANQPIPGTSKWWMGGGAFLWSPGSGGGSGAGAAWEYIYDDVAGTYTVIQGPPTCFNLFADSPGIVGAGYSDVDGNFYNVNTNVLARWTAPLTNPTRTAIATTTGFPASPNYIPGFTQQNVIRDVVLGGTHRAVFVEDDCPACSGLPTNSFLYWGDIGCTSSCGSTQVASQGSFTTAPASVAGYTTTSDSSANRAYCWDPDSNVLEAWNGQGIIYDLTPISTTSWGLAAKNTAPTTHPAIGDHSDQSRTCGALGAAYSHAIIANDQDASIWLYVP